MRVWVTRAEPAAAATAARLTALGHAPLVAPLLEVRRVHGPPPELGDVAALAFTSARGVEAFAALTPVRALPVFAVGDATAAAAQAAGFGDVTSAGRDGEALGALILQSRPAGTVLHPGPREPAFDLVRALLEAGQAARGLTVYETVVVDALPPQMRRSPAEAVLIHSPKAGRALAALAGGLDLSRVRAFALSDACAAPLAELGFAKVEAAPAPKEEALLGLLP